MDSASISSILETVAGLGVGLLAVGGIIGIAICVLIIVCNWKIFKKMGMPGWYCLIPYFSNYMQTKAVYGLGWWFAITLIPTVAGWLGLGGFLLTLLNIVVLVYNIKFNIDLSLCFNRPWWFCFILVFLPFIGLPVLAFGNDAYKGVRAGGPLNMSLV